MRGISVLNEHKSLGIVLCTIATEVKHMKREVFVPTNGVSGTTKHVIVCCATEVKWLTENMVRYWYGLAIFPSVLFFSTKCWVEKVDTAKQLLGYHPAADA